MSEIQPRPIVLRHHYEKVVPSHWEDDPATERPNTDLIQRVVRRGKTVFYAGYNQHTSEDLLMDRQSVDEGLRDYLDRMPQGKITELKDYYMEKVMGEGMDENADKRVKLGLRKAA